jgi:Raf kinase inhibitor-like YbhB/YbcL family protein
MRPVPHTSSFIARWPLALGAALLLAACSGDDVGSELVGTGLGETIELTSAAFDQGAAIPLRYTCDGANLSPPLRWSGVPAVAKSLALVVDDPDARGTWVHWVVYDIPATASELPEGAASDIGNLMGATDGTNDFKPTGYGGPCPPDGPAHRNFFKLLALDSVRDAVPGGATKSELLGAVEGNVVAEGSLMGTYKRQR